MVTRAGGATGDTDHAAVWVPPPLIYAAGFLLGGVVQRAVPLEGLEGGPWRLLGAACMASAVALNASSISSFRRAKTSLVPVKPTSVLVASGPYRFTRNPMYVGLGLLHAGLALWLGMPWALLFLPLVLATVDRFVIRREEGYLARKFGDEYVRYAARVRRWL